jgi:hypothetical protein
MASGSGDPAYTGEDPMTGTNRTAAAWRGRIIRDWVLPAGMAALWLFIAVWLLPRTVPRPWLPPIWGLMAVGPVLGIGIASRSTVWQLLVWLGPLVIAWAIFWAGVRWIAGNAALVLAFVWVVGLMWSKRFGDAVSPAIDGVFQWLVLAGLPASKRKAYRDLRRAMRPTRQERRDQAQLDDPALTIQAFRDQGMRIRAVEVANGRWSEVREAAAAPALQYADMLEGKQTLDYDVANSLVVRKNELMKDLLRHESLPYRILSYVPRH